MVMFYARCYLKKYVLGCNPVSGRIITTKINARSNTLNIVQIYAPTENETLHSALNSILNREITIILGDRNAKVENTTENDLINDKVGKFSLGFRNERGKRLKDYCVEKTLLKQHIFQISSEMTLHMDFYFFNIYN